jgi:DNA-binding response OmpR family regulator
MRILLLEPDRLLAQKYIEFFDLKGYEVDFQTDSQSAIHSIDKQIPDLIIMEIQLAEHNGVEFLYELRSYPEWQDIPLVILSSVPEGEVGTQHLNEKLNITSYIYKPHAKLENLQKIIEEVT